MSTEAEKITSLSQEEMDCIIYDAREGDLETLKEVFEEIPKSLLLSIKDDITLSTPIHMAAANGHFEVVKYLLSIIPKKDAETLASQQNESGNTPLHWAAYNGHLLIVQLLCEEYNVDVFVKNGSGHDVMYEAENNGQEEIENWLLKKYAVEDNFTVDENDDETKITYKPGTESKEADDRANAVASSTTDEIEKKVSDLSIN
ncbi:uncharacterized protein AC631_02632 [Debaryomyces fabryi]|uniref:Uncharacterized protein n=1 Tax=Debaryomyces fabryi TaxID=58627 RepID=A0A0V1PZF4_9ASCO|nr:uncharacterized protein AC631_02632 [Debaryomyces fabryi]KSA01623.1 hypothetical protein AC631_02632 [Debaryomyces fabryi]CUM47173.1 unnamed protein product [Debaryomyces fabryi]